MVIKLSRITKSKFIFSKILIFKELRYSLFVIYKKLISENRTEELDKVKGLNFYSFFSF